MLKATCPSPGIPSGLRKHIAFLVVLGSLSGSPFLRIGFEDVVIARSGIDCNYSDPLEEIHSTQLHKGYLKKHTNEPQNKPPP